MSGCHASRYRLPSKKNATNMAATNTTVHSGIPPLSERNRSALGSVAFSLGPLVLGHLLQSSSASRFNAGAAGFFILSQSGERPIAAIRGLKSNRSR
jgi:hypothetical protein